MSKEQEDQGFRVTDKRLFNEEGKLRDEAAKGAPTPPEAPPHTPPGDDNAPGMEDSLNFPSYLFGYYTQGLIFLGEVPDPYSNKTEENLEAVRHTVDILTMLKEKTKGNLEANEEKLLDTFLFELRMKYMAKANKIKLS
jgi:hypothetical protein